MNLPSLSIVIATYNSEKVLPKCLSSIKTQNYPRERIEIIISDGGSKDNTCEIAKKFGAKVIRPPKNIEQGAEVNRAFGAHQAKNEILVMIDHDNILPYEGWFKDMVEPLIRDKSIVGVGTLRYYYDPKSTPLDRYFALLGISDPLPYYLGKADRSSYAFDGYHGPGIVTDCGKYYLVEFSSDKISTLGANGFLIRREILFKHAKVNLEDFFHIDIHVDLIKKGYNRYAFVKNTIIHQTHHQDFLHYLKRRKLFMEKYHLADLSRRRYSVYEKKDFWSLIYFIIISLTLVKPSLDAIRGYVKIRDTAWFLHPLMCLWTVVIYGYTLLEWKFKQILKIYV